MAEKDESLQSGIDELKNDIKKLKEDLDNLSHSTGDLTKEKIEESRQRVRNAIENLSGKTQQKFHDSYDVLRDRGKEVIEKGKTEITTKPFASVIMAFAAGYIASKIFGRNKQD